MKKQLNSNSQIKIGAIISYIAIIFNIVASFIYTPWMVQQIGKSDYGLYTLAISVITFFLMDFGISGTIARFISLYRAQGEVEKVEDLLGITYKLYIIIDFIILFILIGIFFSINNIFLQLSPQEIEKFKVIFVIVGGFSLVSFPFMPLNGIFVSNEKFVALKIFDLCQKILTIIFVVICLVLGYGVYALVLVNAVVNVVVIIYKNIYLKNNVKFKVNFKCKSKKVLKQIFNFSIWMTIISIAQRLIINISPTILGIFSGSIEISIFSIGVALEGYVWTFANALNGLFLPKVTKMVTNDEAKENIIDLMVKVGRIQLIVIGLLLIGLFSMGREFITLWMGSDFKGSYYVVVFLTLPSLITLTQEIAYNYLVAINEIKYRAYDFIGTAIVSIGLSLILTPKYGAVGAAMSAGIGIFLGHVILMNIIYYKVFRLNVIRFFKECHLKMCVPLGISLVVGLLLQKYVPADSFIIFGIKAISLGIFYFISMWILALNDYEKSLITSLYRVFKNKIIR